MDTTSIDNMYEDDGVANVVAFLSGLNAEPAGPMKRRLVAVLPEYDTADPTNPRLLRLDFLTMPNGAGPLTADERTLMHAAAAIVGDLQRKRANAMAAISAPSVIHPVPHKAEK